MKIRDAAAADLSAPTGSSARWRADVLAAEIVVVAEEDDGAVVRVALARRLGPITGLDVVPSVRGPSSTRLTSRGARYVRGRWPSRPS